MTAIEISNSEMSKWVRCPRQWYISYYLGAAPADPPATSAAMIGTRIHAALEGWRGHGLDPLETLAVIYQLAREQHPDADHDLRKDWELSEIMVTGYLEWLEETGADADLTTVSTEQEVAVPLPGSEGSVTLTAKLDTIERDADGNLYFRDYKTAANFAKHEYLALDQQFKVYSLIMALKRAEQGEYEMTPRVVAMGGIIDTLRRCKRSGSSQPPYYMRDYFRYNADELESTARRVGRICSEILEAREQLDACARDYGNDLAIVNKVQQEYCRPVPVVHDCSWSCPFVTICPAMDDGSDWPGMLTGSGRWVQQSPYAYRTLDLLGQARAKMTQNVGAP